MHVHKCVLLARYLKLAKRKTKQIEPVFLNWAGVIELVSYRYYIQFVLQESRSKKYAIPREVQIFEIIPNATCDKF